ncbi:hypothetical protein CBS101457_006662 [Exobasidium rhododendri]|nr:hypothetical protein CBS101457_006662 [Exobasidium rhododendri]
MALLAYLDFASITLAVIVTIVTCAIESKAKVGGTDATTWYAFLPADQRPGFWKVMLSITNVVLAYAFAQCLPSFMSELKRPQDYKKSLWTLGIIEIAFYTIIGATIYYYKGQEVKSPALLSISPLMQKVVFGIALPVIFISGSINSQTAAKFLYDLIYLNSPKHKYMNTKQGIATWIALGVIVTGIAFVSAEVIPDFTTFLGLLAALFAACFTFTLPACMYFLVLRKDTMRSPQMGYYKTLETGLNGFMFIVGIFVLFIGCAACIISLITHFKSGVSAPFAC